MPKPLLRKTNLIVPGKKRLILPPTIILPKARMLPSTTIMDYILMFYGPPGVGKTTFVDSLAKRVLIISTDRGTRFMSSMRVECQRWKECEAVLTALEAGATKDYDMLAIDHVDDWAAMGEEHVLEKLDVSALTDAGYGKGWSEYKKTLNRFMQRLKRLKLGIVFIAHETTKTKKTRAIEVEQTMPAMSKQAWGVISPVCDVIGYCGFRRIRDPKRPGKMKEVRVLCTEPTEALYAKDRTKRKKLQSHDMQFELLDGASFIKTFQGISNAQEDHEEAEQVRQARVQLQARR